MSARRGKTNQTAQILAIMTEMRAEARDQGEFTAKLVAERAGISTVLLYRYAGEQFQALRNGLPGPVKGPGGVESRLREENRALRAELATTRRALRTVATAELDEAIRAIERLDEENRELRGAVRLLQDRLSEQATVIVPNNGGEARRRKLSVVGSTGEES